MVIFQASTNLHIDMSDAVNVMVHVGIPEDTNRAHNEELVYTDIANAGKDDALLAKCSLGKEKVCLRQRRGGENTYLPTMYT